MVIDKEDEVAPSPMCRRCNWPAKVPMDHLEHLHRMILLDIINVTTKSRLSFLVLITTPKISNLSLMPLKPSCHPQHDMRDAVLKYAIALLNK